MLTFISKISEPGLLEELARRVEAAEAKFESANLDLRLTELEAAKTRQVMCQSLEFVWSIYQINNNVGFQLCINYNL